MIKIPVVEAVNRIDIADFVRLMVRMLGKQYIAERDIEVEHYTSWGFAKVTIFKWCDAGPGCGNSLSRDTMWERHQQAMMTVFEHSSSSNASWRWLPHRGYDDGQTYDTERENYIPAITYFIKTVAA